MVDVRFTEDQSTNLATLYGRALDAQSDRPVLGDPTARDAVARIDYDFGKFKIGKAEAFGIASRGKVFDTIVRDFLARHESATVLHLGCGMDSRVFRIDRPATVRWIDVDFPDVIELRRQVYPDRAETTMLGASVADLAWVDTVPAHRPALVVAEGLSMYLEPAAGKALLRRLAEHLPSGEMFFDAYSRLGIKLQKTNSVVRRAKATLRWGIDDPAELEPLGLTVVSKGTAGDFIAPGDMDRLPAVARIGYKLLVAIPVVRDLGKLLHYRF